VSNRAATIAAITCTIAALAIGSRARVSADPAPTIRVEAAVRPVEPPTTPNWTPTPQPGLSRALGADERLQVLTLEQWRAVQHIAPERQYELARIAWCESRFQADAVGDGGLSRGAWQVQERFWGPVPDTLAEQAKQADRIAAEHGLEPWTTAGGCEGWR